jgi:asparagine synthase (glutamine-hydrolysing)
VVRRALGIPAAFLFEPVRKGFLRKVASLLNLPEEIISRPKKALQYGTGIHKIVQKQYKTFLNL